MSVVQVITPKPGYAWNPLRHHPRNSACVCGSGRKVKKCCGEPLVVTHDVERLILAMIDGALGRVEAILREIEEKHQVALEGREGEV